MSRQAKLKEIEKKMDGISGWIKITEEKVKSKEDSMKKLQEEWDEIANKK